MITVTHLHGFGNFFFFAETDSKLKFLPYVIWLTELEDQETLSYKFYIHIIYLLVAVIFL